MGRLIDADALINYIQGSINMRYMRCEWEKVEGLELALSYVNDAATESQWIPCSEKLPKEKVRVLVTKKINSYNGEHWNYKYIPDIDYIDGNAHWHENGYNKIIAWMPLPGPYKEE